MLIMEVIESVQTMWALLIVFFSKKDGTLRFCVDYQKQELNAVKIQDSCPIPS